MSDVAEVKEAIERMAEAWPRLADGLFDFLADIDMPTETLADLDAAIQACRLVSEAEPVEWCVEHLSNALPEGPGGNPGLRRCWYVSWLLDRASGESVTVCRIVSRLVAAVGVEKETRMDTETKLTADDCLHYGNNHATIRNMECSPTEFWEGRHSCRSCRCGRYQQHVERCAVRARETGETP